MAYPGTYMSPYQQQPPPYGYAPPYGYPPPPPPGGGGNMNNNVLQFLLPLMTTLPGLRAGQTTATTLKANLNALPVPPPLVGNPTLADYNALLTYTNGIKTAVLGAFDNDNATYNVLRQGIMLQLFTQMGQGGAGDNSALFLVLALSFGGGF